MQRDHTADVTTKQAPVPAPRLRRRLRARCRAVLLGAGLAVAATLPAAADEAASNEQFAMGEQLAMVLPGGRLDLENLAVDAAEGREIFNGTCAHCHGTNAEQSVTRRNLRLLHERYGDRMDEVFITTVTHGRASKGMPNWSGILTHEEFMKIRAFLHAVQQAD